MKISVDNDPLFELNKTQKKVLKNEIHDDIFLEDMKRRLQWVIMHKYSTCFEALRKEWMPKLAQRHASVPTNPDEFAELVFSQPDYKSRKQRENS